MAARRTTRSPFAHAPRSHIASSLRLARSEHRRMACSVRFVPAPLRAPTRGAPLAQSTSRAHLPPPFPLHRPLSGLLTLSAMVISHHVGTRSDNCHIDHVAHAARFPHMTTHHRHHAQLPTITLTLFQPSPTSPTGYNCSSQTSYS
ncbi:hypothetical protein GUJ93_ZPchr0003g17176 [Zizania palustris]|uniref:Uncharacterized protein n=1 Tax=Zizania palustris TaxID=103762 RepID=A0A8J5STJ4_ZIZPA|nr:hypothetical protein GUJ93_ZPchr0003g17176 [Zizania palustris]